MANSSSIQHFIPQMEESLLDLIQNLSVFIGNAVGFDDEYKTAKKRLYDEMHRLNIDNNEFLKRLAKNIIDEKETFIDYFRLIKRWYNHLLVLITYINYTPCLGRAEKGDYLRQIGEGILSSVSEINDMDIIDPCERFIVLPGGCMKKTEENAFQSYTDGQTQKDSIPIVRKTPPLNFSRRAPNNSFTSQIPNRPWNSRQGNNTPSRNFQRWPYQ